MKNLLRSLLSLAWLFGLAYLLFFVLTAIGFGYALIALWKVFESAATCGPWAHCNPSLVLLLMRAAFYALSGGIVGGFLKAVTFRD